MAKSKKNMGVDRKAWVVVFGVLIGVIVVFMISSSFVREVSITGYASDNPLGITGEAIGDNSINGSIYAIIGIFMGILLFYLVRRIIKNN